MSVCNGSRPRLFHRKQTYLRQVVVASMAGTVVEWYEFSLYATAATLVFSKVFFPRDGNDLDGIVAAFVTYAVGFLARPLGGVVFGQLGDRYGRKILLQLSLVLIGTATVLMGCLPTFAQIGYWAPALLVVLRFIQGFAIGGEWGGAVLLVAEHSPNASRGFWTSWPQAGVPGGNLVATMALLLLTSTLPDAAFLNWGWRVAFWLSAIFVVIGYYIRTKVTDAQIFVEAQKHAKPATASSLGLVEALKLYPRGVFTGMGLRFGENTMYFLVVTFSITYLKVQEHTSTVAILWWLLAAHLAQLAVIPLAGHLADRFGRRPIYLIGAATAGTWGFVAFPMMNSGRNVIIMSALVIGLVFHSLMFAPLSAVMAETFPTRIRYSGVSLSYQATSIVSGSVAPIIAIRLLEIYESWVPIACYLAATVAVSAVAAVVTRETTGVDLTAIDFADAQNHSARRGTPPRTADIVKAG